MILEMKTESGWNESQKDLVEYLSIGDVVDESMVNYFIEVLMPRTWGSDMIQMGDVWSNTNNGPTYLTIQKIGDDWIYTGARIYREQISLKELKQVT